MTRTEPDEPDEPDKDEDEDEDAIHQMKMKRSGSNMLVHMGHIAQSDTNYMIDLVDNIIGSDDTSDTKQKTRKKR